MLFKKGKWKTILSLLLLCVLTVFCACGGSEEEINEPAGEQNAVQDSTPANDQPQEDTAAEEEVSEPEEEPETEPEGTSEDETPVQEEISDVPDAEPEMEINPDTGKDKYQTEPVPEGKPLPTEPQDVTIGTEAYSCTISISCTTILDNMDKCDPDKAELVPGDGWILEPVTVTFHEGESVFNVLQRTCKQQEIHMEYEDTPIYNSAYIEGINNLYEFDVGDLSGWMYKVNDWFPNYGCSRYQLKDGDVICWVYTCDLGRDVGGDYSAGNVRG